MLVLYASTFAASCLVYAVFQPADRLALDPCAMGTQQGMQFAAHPDDNKRYVANIHSVLSH
jgi:hypothetical protein